MTADFTRSFESSTYVPLTTITGTALTAVSGSPGFYELSGTGETTLDFYVDYNGTKYMRVDAINVTSPNEVPYTAKYGWIVNGKFKEKPPYRGMVAGADADDQIPTALSPGEYVPIGQKHLVRVEAGPGSGTYKIYVNVMASRY